MDQHRAERVSETVREELAEIIGFELEDPRLAIVDVNDVQVAPDLRHAHVRVALSGDEREQRAALQRSTTPAIICATSWRGGSTCGKSRSYTSNRVPGRTSPNAWSCC